MKSTKMQPYLTKNGHIVYTCENICYFDKEKSTESIVQTHRLHSHDKLVKKKLYVKL